MSEETNPRLTGVSVDPAVPPAARIGSITWHWTMLGYAVVLLVVVGAAIFAYRHLSKAAPLVATPSNPVGLDPMLRNYITEKVAWVHEAPRDSNRHGTLGLVYAANGLWLEASLAFQTAVQLDPQQPLALLYLAVCQQELGQPNRALGLLRELTSGFPNFAPGFYRLGDYALRVGAVEEAECAFRRLIELAPREWRGFAGLGEANLRRGDAVGAVRLLEQAVRIEPTAKPAHALLGQAYQRQGRVQEAQRELALGLNSSHYPMPDAWSEKAPEHMRLPFDLIEMAQGYIKTGAPAKAAQLLEKAVPFHRDHPSLLVTLASAYTVAGEPRKALPILGHVLQVDASSVPAYVALSACDLALGHVDQARSNADRAILLDTNRAEPYLAKANALLAQERDAEAVVAMELAHRCDSNNAQILLDLGDIRLRNLDQPDLALADYRLATARDPSLVLAHLRVAELSLKMGDRPSAMASLEAARQLAPTDPTIAAALARLKRTSPQ
jgi:tetratricopeptide (TPR) repeat protein